MEKELFKQVFDSASKHRSAMVKMWKHARELKNATLEHYCFQTIIEIDTQLKTMEQVAFQQFKIDIWHL